LEDDEEKRREWAEFRFGVIAPLVCGKYSAAEKEIIRRAILSKSHETPEGGLWQVKERTLRRWVAAHRLHGLKGLYDRRRSTRGKFTAIDSEIVEAAKALRQEMRSRSVKDILHHLTVRGIDVSKVSKTTLNLYLNRLGAKKEKPYSDQGAYQRWQKRHINALWQSDCSDGVWLPDPTGLKRVKQTTLITFIDDASRLCTHGEFFFGEHLANLLDCFKKAASKRGKCEKIYTDNGSIYRSKQWKSVCAELSIDRVFSEKQRPPGRGKVERHYLTIQRSFYKEANAAGLQTLKELNEFFWAWLDGRYHKEKQEGIGQAPLERWQKEEETIERIAPEKLEEALKLRANRTVNFKTAHISLNGRLYQASKELGGERVQVRWPFDSVDEVEVWRQGEFIEKAKLFVPSTDIDYSKRPERTKGPEPGEVLEGAKQYRLALVARYRGEKYVAGAGDSGLMTQSEFVNLFKEFLGRELDESESKQCGEFYDARRPLLREFVNDVLCRCAAEKGRGMHIKVYLRRIDDKQRKMR
jgi:putative transposase